MKVHEIMSSNPACCTPDSNLHEVARLMAGYDCGEIPVVESNESMRPLGVVTDRDIVCRAVAAGKNALEMTAKDCMSTPCVTVTADANVNECCSIMEDNRVRRVPVVDEAGRCCGIVSQADIALHASGRKTAEVLKEVSQPTAAQRSLAEPPVSSPV